jgi:hypothetical protein
MAEPQTQGSAPSGWREAGATAGTLRSHHKMMSAEKKECLNLTNKAIMLLKTKDRENEQSRTKPILPVGKPARPVVKPTLQTGPIWQPIKTFDFLTITPQRE